MEIDMKIKMGPTCFPGIYELDQGLKIDEQQILELCMYIDLRYDCADFRMVSIIRTVYSYKELLSEETVEAIKTTILNFKYWMDEPGDDSMCYWSENHQILFASVEYLAGQLYPELLFPNAGLTGNEHMLKAHPKILRWLEYRFYYGFTEWHSNTYYEEDIAALSILIDFSQDEEVVEKSKIIMDLLLLDMAMHSYEGLFVASSGRCYEKQKKEPKAQNTLEISECVWHFGHVKQFDYKRITANFLIMKNYKVPEIIKQIGLDKSEVIIKDSMGLNLDEIRNEFDDFKDIDTTGMFLWAMESFTNPESINMALKVFNKWKLYNNEFIKDLKMVNHPVLRKSGLLPLLVKILNPVTQGVAIQRANTYTYKTKDYMLSTVQNYHPGEFGDQQHVWQATLSENVTVFTTHPGCPFFDDVHRNFSPSYWVGNGIMPHSAQYKNVHMSIYDLNKRKGFMERERLNYTHAYFPKDLFHETIHESNRIYGRLSDVYIALIGKNELKFNEKDQRDLIQDGKETFWICELGTKEVHQSFELFCDTMRKREISFKDCTLEYNGKTKLSLTYMNSFKVDGQTVDTEYDRYETPYVNAKRKSKEFVIRHMGRQLCLNFENRERKQT